MSVSYKRKQRLDWIETLDIASHVNAAVVYPFFI